MKSWLPRRKPLPRMEAEWLRDRIYKREKKEEEMYRLINHYQKMKVEV